MKYIDDLEEVMHITGETNYVELQKGMTFSHI